MLGDRWLPSLQGFSDVPLVSDFAAGDPRSHGFLGLRTVARIWSRLVKLALDEQRVVRALYVVLMCVWEKL